jgi:Holliday junction resolvasome RuvABC endonuclease subunit
LIIVAFDLGRRTGWATNWKLARPRWGLIEFADFRAHRMMELARALSGELLEIKKGDLRTVFPPKLLKAVDAVVFETPFARGRAATRSMWGMAGVLEACASEAGKPVVDVSVATIKKFATGHGHAPKNSMIAAAQKLGYRGDDDNEADAYCLLKYAEANLEKVIK